MHTKSFFAFNRQTILQTLLILIQLQSIVSGIGELLEDGSRQYHNTKSFCKMIRKDRHESVTEYTYCKEFLGFLGDIEDWYIKYPETYTPFFPFIYIYALRILKS